VRRRLDAELVRRGLAPSRARAVEAISAQRVMVGGAVATSATRLVAPHEPIHVAPAPSGYVSRAGEKLAAALDAFGIEVAGLRCVDAGASTGGFTDCLLQRGAASVVAVDVGRGQLAWPLRQDPRVAVRERTNVRYLQPGDVEPPADLVVADLSFISLRTAAPGLLAAARPDATMVLLVKPQFEAGPRRVGRGGVVRDPAVHAAVLREVVDGLAGAGIGVTGVIASPIRGADGNVEFLARARPGAATVTAEVLDAAVEAAHAPHGGARPGRM
jgi:23S rRNA (cytidine1920-2'-O)/16S rRNA (cytidine1409-2'-O)-methyltransferase